MNRWCLSITIAAMTFCPNWALAQAFPADTTYTSPRGGLTIRPLVGPDISRTDAFEMAEIIFPAGYRGGNHVHGTTEIFYIVSGVLEHVVNDEVHVLEPGMVGYVHPPDRVAHRVSGDAPVVAIVLWIPEGEGERIYANWSKQIRRP
ncbi:MAG: cupin domain-containing protein [Gemmatimonadetes bacterium]|nr:cupin domain-containing protein [Gemmatimonadota bacterium]